MLSKSLDQVELSDRFSAREKTLSFAIKVNFVAKFCFGLLSILPIIVIGVVGMFHYSSAPCVPI